MPRRTCKIVACGRKADTIGFCATHYRRHRLGLPMHAPIRDLIKNHSERCTVEGCQDKYHAKGLCPKHYKEWRRKNHKREDDERRRARYAEVKDIVNARRRKRYAEDPEYREKRIQHSRMQAERRRQKLYSSFVLSQSDSD